MQYYKCNENKCNRINARESMQDNKCKRINANITNARE